MKHWTELDEQRLRERRASGMRIREIAEEFEVPSTTVQRACREWDIPSPLGANGSRNSPRQEAKFNCDWQDAVERGSASLLRAIRKHHPDRVTA